MSVDDHIYISTLNRHEHFRDCVELLAKCKFDFAKQSKERIS